MNLEFEKYAAEAKARWGKTDAYKECAEKTKGQSKDELFATGERMMKIIAEIGGMRNLDPGDERVKSCVKTLQQFITDNYYKCTDEILTGLGQMYIADERFKNNIDKFGGEGTAEYVSKAIEAYCARV